MVNDESFESVWQQVQQRADRMLPDRVVHTADLRMNDLGQLYGPGLAPHRLNAYAQQQLATLLGVRWRRWFDGITPPERAEEVSRRLMRTPGEIKLRMMKDDERESAGVVRALLSPSFTPIDDVRIFERLHNSLKGVLDGYRFTNVLATEETTHYTALHAETLDIKGDPHFPGWAMRNSEVGASALSLDDYILRQVCTNGLRVKVDGKPLLYRTHRSIDDDQLAAAFVIALSRLPARWNEISTLLTRAKDAEVPHPDAAVAAILDAATIPRALVAEAQTIALRDADRTRFGVVQAITFVAHETNKDPDVRFAMERLAGEYLAAA